MTLVVESRSEEGVENMRAKPRKIVGNCFVSEGVVRELDQQDE